MALWSRIPNRVLVALVAAGCVAAVQFEARTADSESGPVAAEMTADELLNHARYLFGEAQWPAAAAAYRAFLDSYGAAAEVERLLPGIRHDLAVALLQSNQLGAALEAMVEALDGQPALTDPQRQELTFWRGVCLMQEEKFAEARETLENFIELFPAAMLASPAWRFQHPAAAKIPEARLLIGTTFLLEGQFTGAADYLAEAQADFRVENKGRAAILKLYALLEAGAKDPAMLDRATELVIGQFSRLDELTQVAAFQSLTLQLGAQFLDHGDYRKALRCLQRIWASERILRHQQERLEELESRLEAAEANPRSDPYQRLLLNQMIAKVRREIDSFGELENFDSALRLRLATAYQAMERYREAALIMEDMLERMPPDPVVESAAVSLVHCWNLTERWPKVESSAAKFEQTFPHSESLPQVLYIRGVALQNDNRPDEAIAVFDRLLSAHPESEFAARALFMRGFTRLLAEDNPGAIADFEEFPKKFPGHEMEEPALYWLGMANSLDGRNETTREVMDRYLAKYPSGSLAGAAKFRKAYAAQQMMDFETSRRELEAFLAEHPGHELQAEALVLLGDALMHEGRMEEGIAAFQRIPPEQTRFFEEGWFKVGRALKLMEEYDRMLEHMLRFRDEHPGSPRVAEALFHAGWVMRQNGEDDRARDLYWQAIREYGADPAMRSVEELFPALARLYPGDDGRKQYLARLRDLREAADAEDEGGATLILRSLWAEAAALLRTDPEAARLLLFEAARFARPESTNPMLLADIARARLDSGDRIGAEKMFRDLVKWNPRAPQKDQALANLGFIELDRGRPAAALEHFARFERECPGSALIGRVLLAKARLEFERGQSAGARRSLETLLASDAAGGQEKAEALYLLGEMQMQDGKPNLAVPYYQRIYIMHGRWRDWVAKAYLRSGEAFEKLGDRDAARRTYAEMLDQPGLEEFSETAEARRRLDRLGGPPPPPESQAAR